METANEESRDVPLQEDKPKKSPVPQPRSSGTQSGRDPGAAAGFDADLLQLTRTLLLENQQLKVEQSRPTDKEEELKVCKAKLAAAESTVARLSERVQLLEKKFEEKQRMHEEEVQTVMVEFNTLRVTSISDKKRIQEMEAAFKKILAAKAWGSQFEEELREAEKALVAKQEHIDKLKEELEKLDSKAQNAAALRNHVKELREELEAETRALTAKEQENRRLQSSLDAAHAENARLASLVNSPQSPPMPGSATTSMPYQCPICNYFAPDYDTIEIHMHGCIT